MPPDTAYIRLRLGADLVATPSEFAALLTDIESLYWLAVELATDDGDAAGTTGYWEPFTAADAHAETPFSERESFIGVTGVEAPGVTLLRFGSPLTVLLNLPWEVWLAAGGAIVTAITTAFGLPMKAAAEWQKHRSEFWIARLEADEAKPAWLLQAARRNQGISLVEVSTPPVDAERVPAIAEPV